MRRAVTWILVVTVLANLGLAAHLWLGADEESDNLPDEGAEFASRLEFHEAGQSAVEEGSAQLDLTSAVASISDTVQAPAQCLYWGPFDDESAARRQVDVLLAAEVLKESDEGVLRSERVQRAPDFLIYLGPYPNLRSARSVRQELLGKDTEASVITRDNKILVSVGVFSQKRFADAQIRKVRKMGYEPRQSEIVRTQRVYFVMADMDPVLIDSLTGDRPELRPVDLCSSIASR